MSIDAKTADKIAHLARLKVPAEEKQSVAGDLNKILGWVEQLNALNVSNVEPLANVNDEALRRRKDIINDGGHPKDILANAPSSAADFFTVPKVVE